MNLFAATWAFFKADIKDVARLFWQFRLYKVISIAALPFLELLMIPLEPVEDGWVTCV